MPICHRGDGLIGNPGHKKNGPPAGGPFFDGGSQDGLVVVLANR